MKFYIANKYAFRQETQLAAWSITDELGWECTSRWLSGKGEGLSDRELAVMDMNDLLAANVLVYIYDGPLSRGRNIEFGAAYAWGKPIFCIRKEEIGRHESPFMFLPGVDQYESIAQFVEKQKQWSMD